jgi:hypothetical protein
MQYRTLGRTGWRVSLLGLGSGGTSRLGQRYDPCMPPLPAATVEQVLSTFGPIRCYVQPLVAAH